MHFLKNNNLFIDLNGFFLWKLQYLLLFVKIGGSFFIPLDYRFLFNNQLGHGNRRLFIKVSGQDKPGVTADFHSIS
jgi:hypothetical protein